MTYAEIKRAEREYVIRKFLEKCERENGPTLIDHLRGALAVLIGLLFVAEILWHGAHWLTRHWRP